MLTIRLARVGTKNRPSYRIIICEKGRDNFGKVLENLGTYNSFTKDLKVNEEKMKSWISKGAQLSATLNNLFVTKGIIKGEKQKSRRMNTEKIIKKRKDKEVADKKAVDDAKVAVESASARATADKAIEEVAKVAADKIETPAAVEAPVVESTVAAAVEAPVAAKEPAVASEPVSAPVEVPANKAEVKPISAEATVDKVK